MPWINIRVTTDDDKENVGTATAQWRTPEGVELYPYSRRVEMTVEEGELFVEQAKNDRDRQLAKRMRDQSLTGDLGYIFTLEGEVVE